jgi:type IV secretion system protein TrbL
MGARAGAGALVGAARGAASVISGKAFSAAAGSSTASTGPPAWARKLRRQQTMSHGVSAAVHTLRSGDHGGGSMSVDLKEK